MKKVFIFFVTLLSISTWSQTVILQDINNKAQDVLRFDQVNDYILFQVCQPDNNDNCVEAGELSTKELHRVIDEGISKRNKAGIASLGALALTGVGLYLGLIQESEITIGLTVMLAPFCQGIPFSLFMKHSDQYMTRSQTADLLGELDECAIGDRRVNEVYNYDMLKNYLIKLAD